MLTTTPTNPNTNTEEMPTKHQLKNNPVKDVSEQGEHEDEKEQQVLRNDKRKMDPATESNDEDYNSEEDGDYEEDLGDEDTSDEDSEDSEVDSEEEEDIEEVSNGDEEVEDEDIDEGKHETHSVVPLLLINHSSVEEQDVDDEEPDSAVAEVAPAKKRVKIDPETESAVE